MSMKIQGLGGYPKVKSVEMLATVIRADGTVEDRGVIAYWHRNPLKRWAWALRHRANKES